MFASQWRIAAVVLWMTSLIGMAASIAPVQAGSRPDKPKAAGDKILGGWKAVSIQMNGQETAEAFKAGRWEITKDEIALRIGRDAVVWTYTRDASKTPKIIDLTSTSGPDKGKTFLGIWTLEGETLKICFGKERPKTFDASAGTDQALYVLKREKAATD